MVNQYAKLLQHFFRSPTQNRCRKNGQTTQEVVTTIHQRNRCTITRKEWLYPIMYHVQSLNHVSASLYLTAPIRTAPRWTLVFAYVERPATTTNVLHKQVYIATSLYKHVVLYHHACTRTGYSQTMYLVNVVRHNVRVWQDYNVILLLTIANNQQDD